MAYVQGITASSGAASGLTTAGVTTTTGNFLAAVVSLGSGPKTLTSITDSKGNTWTAASGNPKTPNGQYNVYVYYAKNITGGSGHTITTAHSGSGICALSVIELSGRDTGSPIDYQFAETDAATSSHAATATGTLPNSGDDMLCLVGDNAFDQVAANETYTATSTGWTLPAATTVSTGATTATSFIMYRENVSTASQQATWTDSNGNLSSGIFTLAIKAAAGSSNAKLLTMISNQAGF